MLRASDRNRNEEQNSRSGYAGLKWLYFLFFAFSNFFAFSDECPILFEERCTDNALFYDLAVAQYWDEQLSRRLPVTYNFLLESGYFVTPSGRMGEAGEIGTGFAYVPPYYLLNFRCQLFDHLEVSANYKIFRGVEDLLLSQYGYGDFTDRGANIKFALATPEDSSNELPGIAVGAQDFMGSKRFTTYYVVATKNWMKQGLETTLGWGNGRFANKDSKGFFGGIAWFPFFNRGPEWAKGMSLAAEYDPIDYSDPCKEPHPNGRFKRHPINFGAKYKFGDIADIALANVRGDELAVSGSLNYNWGKTSGFLAKIDDPAPYCCSNIIPFPFYEEREVEELTVCFDETFKDQGFKINCVWIEECEDYCQESKKKLWIQLINLRYREEWTMRHRLNCLLAALVPNNIDEVIVILESVGLPCQSYYYSQEMLHCFAQKRIGNYEMEMITPMHDVIFPNPYTADLIFSSPPCAWHLDVSPRFETFLNNAKGKFKYDLGLRANIEGLLPKNFYYELGCSFIALSTMRDINDFDLYNPSQLWNVQSDYIRYRQQSAFTIDQAYLQKCWNMGQGWFGRLSAGYFEVAFAGFAGEILFYPANTNFAIGFEGAFLKKRRYAGLGFFNTLRRLEGYTPVYQHYTLLSQYFLDFYFDYQPLNVNFKFSLGQFLARDRGLRIEMTRYFESGLRLSIWYTISDANDIVNDQIYHDKGVAIELPLDIFFKCRSRRIWNYGMAAWLRDSGATSETGRPLYEFINLERR